MKRGVEVVGFLFAVLLMMSFVSAQDTCESIGSECGIGRDEHGGELDCGSCDSGYACVTGDCYDVNELGECMSSGEKNGGDPTTCKDMRIDALAEEDKEGICENAGCEYDSNNPSRCVGARYLVLLLEKNV